MLLDDFRRVTKACRCPVCDHPDWCMVSKDDPPSRAICQRVESKHRWGDAGWLHVLHDDGRTWVRTRKIIIPVRRPLADFSVYAAKCRDRVRPAQLERFAGALGVTTESLERLGIGWDGRNWSFPMSDAEGLVRGIRLRTRGGDKFAVTGSKQGLFIPGGLGNRNPLLITEGPTDTAAALDLRFDAVGRPSGRGGTHLVIEYVRRHKPGSVVGVADTDAVGRAGQGSGRDHGLLLP
ncbi:MAG: hypothetical protein IPJ41_16385 [Phycisphaerales bacterium]|nr:hypothetical protein [Phycisphaerales bacterium]